MQTLTYFKHISLSGIL